MKIVYGAITWMNHRTFDKRSSCPITMEVTYMTREMLFRSQSQHMRQSCSKISLLMHHNNLNALVQILNVYHWSTKKTIMTHEIMKLCEHLSISNTFWRIVRRVYEKQNATRYMMTSSNGNIFRVTGHFCGEFTGPRCIPRTKASN